MNKLLLVTSGGLLMAAALTAWSGRRVQQQALAAHGASARELSVAKEQMTRIAERTLAAKQDATALQAKLKQARASKTKATANALPKSQAPENTGSLTPEAAKLKELEAIAKTKDQFEDLADNRRRATNAYQSFFRELKLTPQQIEKFLKIREQRSERETVMGEMQKEGRITAAEREKLRLEQFQTDHAAYRELLGDAGFQRLLDYNRSTPAREIIASFGATAALAGAPFTSIELDRLVDVVVAAYARTGSGSWWSDRMFATWEIQPIDWHLAEPRLRVMMTDAQWKIFTSQNANIDGGGTTYFFNKFRTLASQAYKADRAAEKMK